VKKARRGAALRAWLSIRSNSAGLNESALYRPMQDRCIDLCIDRYSAAAGRSATVGLCDDGSSPVLPRGAFAPAPPICPSHLTAVTNLSIDRRHSSVMGPRSPICHLTAVAHLSLDRGRSSLERSESLRSVLSHRRGTPVIRTRSPTRPKESWSAPEESTGRPAVQALSSDSPPALQTLLLYGIPSSSAAVLGFRAAVCSPCNKGSPLLQHSTAPHFSLIAAPYCSALRSAFALRSWPGSPAVTGRGRPSVQQTCGHRRPVMPTSQKPLQTLLQRFRLFSCTESFLLRMDVRKVGRSSAQKSAVGPAIPRRSSPPALPRGALAQPQESRLYLSIYFYKNIYSLHVLVYIWR
jgi:hypothetical protein